MKTKITFALAAILTSSAFAAFQAPLPEFKNEKQLAEWRAEMAAKNAAATTTEDTAFYTGKPYLASTNSYAFKYRNYNPELARWTSEDPSGFPDGANGNIYAPKPTSGVDPTGCFSISVTNSATYNSSSEDHNARSSDIKKIDGFTPWMKGLLSPYTTAGWSFYNTGSDLTVNITNYTSNADASGGGVLIEASIAGSPNAAHQFRWIQMMDQHNYPHPAGTPPRAIDNPFDVTKPFYDSDANLAAGLQMEGVFYDRPNRPWPAANHTTEWQAWNYLVDYNATTKTVKLLGGFSYGFQLE